MKNNIEIRIELLCRDITIGELAEAINVAPATLGRMLSQCELPKEIQNDLIKVLRAEKVDYKGLKERLARYDKIQKAKRWGGEKAELYATKIIGEITETELEKEKEREGWY